MKLQINIFTSDLVWMGAVDAVESFVHRTSWHEISNSELTVSKTAQGVEELQIGRILIVNNQKDKALIIEDLTASLDDEYINFTLIPLKGILNYRICHPTDSGSFTATRQSVVMLELVRKNLVTQTRDNDRKFWNAAGTINLLSVVPNINYGDTIDFTVDWKTGYLGEALTFVSKMYGVNADYPIGWNIYIKDDFSGYEMNVYWGARRTITQTILPPVVFSEEFGNIKNALYEYSIKEWRNVAYMVWENDAGTITNSTVGNTVHGATVSFNRKEIIIDSSKTISGEVVNEGRSELNKRPHIEGFTAEIINNDRTMTTFQEDWNLGDIVTIQSEAILKDTLISIDAQITEVEETYAGGEYSINATFGEGRLSVFQLIKNAIEQKK